VNFNSESSESSETFGTHRDLEHVLMFTNFFIFLIRLLHIFLWLFYFVKKVKLLKIFC